MTGDGVDLETLVIRVRADTSGFLNGAIICLLNTWKYCAGVVGLTMCTLTFCLACLASSSAINSPGQSSSLASERNLSTKAEEWSGP